MVKDNPFQEKKIKKNKRICDRLCDSLDDESGAQQEYIKLAQKLHEIGDEESSEAIMTFVADDEIKHENYIKSIAEKYRCSCVLSKDDKSKK